MSCRSPRHQRLVAIDRRVTEITRGDQMFNPYDERALREERAAEQAAEDLDRATYTSLSLRRFDAHATITCRDCGWVLDGWTLDSGDAATLDEIAQAAHTHQIEEH